MKRLLSGLAVAALAFTACGGGEETAAGDGEDFTSPLSEFLGEPSFGFGGDQEEQEQAFVEQERERQEAIAVCMKAEGFEYIPEDPSQFIGFDGLEDDIEYGSKEYVEKYGFGITTQRFSQSQVGPDLIGHNFDDFGGPDEDFVDPNQAIVEAMSDSEREAYDKALWGDEFFVEPDATMSEEEQEAAFEDFSGPGGCWGEADSTSRFYTEFSDELDEMYTAMRSDPRVVEADAETASCVADKGLEFTSMDNLFQELETKLSEIDDSSSDPFGDLSEEDFEAMSEAEIQAMFNAGPPELSDADKAILAELQAEEIELAAAVEECGGGAGAQEELFRELIVEFEEKFIADNADKLEEFKAS